MQRNINAISILGLELSIIGLNNLSYFQNVYALGIKDFTSSRIVSDIFPPNNYRKLMLLLGTRYMVVDCGGGTVDITVHEMESKHGNLTELYKATGGPYGSVGRCRLHIQMFCCSSLGQICFKNIYVKKCIAGLMHKSIENRNMICKIECREK